MMQIRNIILFISISFIFLACATKAPEEKKVEIDSTDIILKQVNAKAKALQLDTFFQHRFQSGNFSGCVLVAQHGVVIYEKSCGWANREKRDSLSLSSSFQLASVSKQFTAAAIMLLHQEGKLNYDDSIGKFIPGFIYHGITIKNLLTHRGGLDKYENICDNYYRDQGIDPPSTFNNDNVISILTQLKVRPNRNPDLKFQYSNTGYAILADVVEKISGKPFCVFMQDNFFTPLHMEHTWIATDGKNHDSKTKGYFGRWSWWQDNFLDGVTGDKGVYSSVEDMFTWDRSLRKGKILKYETLREAFNGYSPELDKRKYWNYGFGWRIISFEDGAKAVFHNGWWHGFTSAFYRGLTDDVTVIILCNKENKGIYNIQALLGILGAHVLPVVDDEGESDSVPAKKVEVKKVIPKKVAVKKQTPVKKHK